MKVKPFSGPKSVCKCGHVGDGERSAHGGIVGHGPCTVAGCDCAKFSWARFTEEFEEAAKRQQAQLNAPRPETNVEFVSRMMEFSDYGALAQLFVLDALDKWSKMVAETPIEEVRRQFGSDSLINPDSWCGVAAEIQRKLKERTGQ